MIPSTCKMKGDHTPTNMDVRKIFIYRWCFLEHAFQYRRRQPIDIAFKLFEVKNPFGTDKFYFLPKYVKNQREKIPLQFPSLKPAVTHDKQRERSSGAVVTVTDKATHEFGRPQPFGKKAPSIMVIIPADPRITLLNPPRESPHKLCCLSDCNIVFRHGMLACCTP